tara:strand:+ start:715 stop:1755 length:1041 start_codon:yes stop_codon:yes gene_type:complete
MSKFSKLFKTSKSMGEFLATLNKEQREQFANMMLDQEALKKQKFDKSLKKEVDIMEKRQRETSAGILDAGKQIGKTKQFVEQPMSKGAAGRGVSLTAKELKQVKNLPNTSSSLDKIMKKRQTAKTPLQKKKMDLMYAFKKNQIDAESKLKRAKIKQVRDVEDKKKKPKTVTPKTPTKNKVTPKTQTKNKVTKVSRGDRKKPTTKTPTTKTPTPKTPTKNKITKITKVSRGDRRKKPTIKTPTPKTKAQVKKETITPFNLKTYKISKEVKDITKDKKNPMNIRFNLAKDKTQAMQLQTAQNNILEKAKNRKVKGKIKPTTAKLYRRNNPNDPDVKAYNAIMKARGKL